MKLNLGCGNERLPGYINADIVGGDEFCNLSWQYWPWKDNSADEIRMWQVLEHLQNTDNVLNEVVRILKPGGTFHGLIPHCYSSLAYRHYQHVKFFHPLAIAHIPEFFPLKLLFIKCRADSVTWKHKVRNLIPLKHILTEIGVKNMFDSIEFKFVKL